MYTPDRWLVIRLYADDYRIFGTWLGGYTSGDSWRMNSGISRVEDCGDHFLVHGYSGSVYKCWKGSEGCNAWSYGIASHLIKDNNGLILDNPTEFLEEFKND